MSVPPFQAGCTSAEVLCLQLRQSFLHIDFHGDVIRVAGRQRVRPTQPAWSLTRATRLSRNRQSGKAVPALVFFSGNNFRDPEEKLYNRSARCDASVTDPGCEGEFLAVRAVASIESTGRIAPGWRELTSV
jgi:hypothetical protein